MPMPNTEKTVQTLVLPSEKRGDGKKMKLTDYLAGILAATTAEELDFALKMPFKHAFRGRTWTRICNARIEAGAAICEAHPNRQYVPRMVGRRLTVCGETCGVGRGGNSTGVRYAWADVESFAKSVLKRKGFSTRAAAQIWDCWSDYPHRCLKIIETALAGGYPDPVMDTLIFGYSGTNPVNITTAQNDAEGPYKRATLACKCGGTLFDWGCGTSSDITFVNWHCNKCPDVYTEYVTPARFREIRALKKAVSEPIGKAQLQVQEDK